MDRSACRKPLYKPRTCFFGYPQLPFLKGTSEALSLLTKANGHHQTFGHTNLPSWVLVHMEEAMKSDVYRLTTDTIAKKKAKKLVDIVDLMGFEIKLSRSQELIARLMGYDDWSELKHLTRTEPGVGIPDQMLPPRLATKRRKYQEKLLAEEFGVESWGTSSLLRALSPTGEVTGLDFPLIQKLGLRLTDEDLAWHEKSMRLVRQFDSEIRPLYGMSRDPHNALTQVSLQNHVPGKRKLRNRQPTRAEDIVRNVLQSFPDGSSPTAEALQELENRAERACKVFFELDARIRDLGMAPMLAAVDWVFLKLFRAHVSGGKEFYTALAPEPWLHIGFDLPHFCFSPGNEWGASRALALQLALRREFLDAGWSPEGDPWVVTFREGNSSKEEMTVTAASAGNAFAWVAAARGAIRIAKGQSPGVISLVSALGQDGAADPEQTLLEAQGAAIVKRGKLVEGSRLRIRGRKKPRLTSPLHELSEKSINGFEQTLLSER